MGGYFSGCYIGDRFIRMVIEYMIMLRKFRDWLSENNHEHELELVMFLTVFVPIAFGIIMQWLLG